MGKKVFVFVIFGIIRRQLLILTTVFVHNNIAMSIISMIFQAQIMIMIIGEYPPFKDTSQNNMELLNEFFCILTTYHLLLLTDYLVDTDARENVGTSLVTTICACILINILVVIISNLVAIHRKIKLALLKRNSESNKLKTLEKRKEKFLNKIAKLKNK